MTFYLWPAGEWLEDVGVFESQAGLGFRGKSQGSRGPHFPLVHRGREAVQVAALSSPFRYHLLASGLDFVFFILAEGMIL